jgi:DNA-binding transcriptional LysR family regulator
MELKDVNLNLLVVFNQLLQERRVSAAARSLDLSQPAVSNALKRMRRMLGDELFVRTARGMEPTPFAEQVAEPIAYALGTIHSTLNRRDSFDPLTSTRSFTIAMTDIGEVYFLPVLMKNLARVAPGVPLNTVRNTAIRLKDQMEAGKVDLAIGLIPDLKAGFFQRRLFRQRYVCLFRKGHPLDKPRISIADFAAAEHVVIVSEGTGHGKIDELIEDAGIQRAIKLRVPHFVAVADILQTTDLVATVTEKFAKRSATSFGLRYATHPVKLPEISINLFWHAKCHREPGNQWLRTPVFDTFAE